MANSQRTSGSSSRPVSAHTRVEAGQLAVPVDVFMTPSIEKRGQPSPSPSPSPPCAKILPLKRAASTPPETTNENSILRSSRGTGGELGSVSNSQQSWNRQLLSKKRSQYYDGAFAYRESNNTARARVTRDSLVIAEVKLYCKVNCSYIRA
jgi:hypothetical protein